MILLISVRILQSSREVTVCGPVIEQERFNSLLVHRASVCLLAYFIWTPMYIKGKELPQNLRQLPVKPYKVIPVSQMICQQNASVPGTMENHLANKYAREYNLNLYKCRCISRGI